MKRLGVTLSVIFTIALIACVSVVLFKNYDGNKSDTVEERYATDITISVDFRSLTIYLGNRLKFKDNPYTVAPLDYNQGVEIKIVNYLGKERDDATYKDNCFVAEKTGTYYIRFIVKTKYNTEKYDVLKITVVDKIDDNCKGVILYEDAKVITINESLDISSFVELYNLGTGRLSCVCKTGKILGSIFYPTGIGSYNVEVGIDNGDYFIYDIFIVIVENNEDIGIALYDISNKKIESGENVKCILGDKFLLFSYIIEGVTFQRIKVEIENKEIVSLISSDSPIIQLELTKVGETEIIIKIPDKAYEFKFMLIVE